MSDSLTGKTAKEINRLFLSKDISAVEAAKVLLERINATDGQVKGYLTVCQEQALQAAEDVDRRFNQGEPVTPLTGVPVAIKDNMCMTGIKTTCASKILDNFVPTYTATAVQRLIKAGAIPVGKTNMDEFAMGSSTENSAYYPTCNPWDLERVPGGSSGGSAAVVAADMAFLALGSDTGGSIRQPASFCGVVGLKPTYGLVSRFGLIAFASSLDQIGPLTKTVEDCAMVLNAIIGHDPMDSTSIPYDKPDYTQALTGDIAGLHIGVIRELTGEGIDADVADSFQASIKTLEKLGAVIDQVSLPSLELALPAYYLIAPSEASSNLARFDGVRYGYRAPGQEDMIEMYRQTRGKGFGDEVKRRIMLGTYALSAGYYDAYYGQALKVRTKIVEDFNAAFTGFDVLVSPTAPTTAFKLGEKLDDPWQMYLSDICTIPVNLAGIPALSVPCGLHEGLPVGLQIVGPALGEMMVLQVAYAFEQKFRLPGKPKL